MPKRTRSRSPQTRRVRRRLNSATPPSRRQGRSPPLLTRRVRGRARSRSRSRSRSQPLNRVLFSPSPRRSRSRSRSHSFMDTQGGAPTYFRR